MEKPGCNSSHSKKKIQPLRYLREEAEAIEKELLEEFRFGQQQLIEIWGHACAMAVAKVFPLHSLVKKQPTLLVVCGCEQNGAIGLACARHLRVFEYEPTIFYPKRSSNPLYRDFTTQCEKMDIPFLFHSPIAEVQLISDAYNLVIDAILGVEANPAIVAERRQPPWPLVSKPRNPPPVSLDAFPLGGTWRPAAAKESVPMSLSRWPPPSNAPPGSWASTTWWLGVSSHMMCRRNSNSICRSILAQSVWFLFKDLEALAVKLSWVLLLPKRPSACIFGMAR
ncbi:yjeF N-terminal domain-containing 3-like isoform X2 [Sphaerodactylus townsendi]|uniref:yjeF N-terminal domain-containing 3-like isoform X2 n=1 Tax=Sphaerodactylus townsendi TaxID=933632 RepID=UPI0020275FFC|nr:yjeF N-terminal domain-containing 3-like isoform X2 [Sphaerodactylus townsendi]